MLDAQTLAEPNTVAVSQEAAENPVLTPCKCAKPAIAIMDYDKRSPDDWSMPQPRINRACTKCWAHWFGPPDAVRFYTSKEWDHELSQL